MGIGSKEVLFLLQSIGVDVKSPQAALDESTVLAILQGKTHAPKQLIVRDNEARAARPQKSALNRIKIIDKAPGPRESPSSKAMPRPRPRRRLRRAGRPPSPRLRRSRPSPRGRPSSPWSPRSRRPSRRRPFPARSFCRRGPRPVRRPGRGSPCVPPAPPARRDPVFLRRGPWVPRVIVRPDPAEACARPARPCIGPLPEVPGLVRRAARPARRSPGTHGPGRAGARRPVEAQEGRQGGRQEGGGRQARRASRRSPWPTRSTCASSSGPTRKTPTPTSRCR